MTIPAISRRGAWAISLCGLLCIFAVVTGCKKRPAAGPPPPAKPVAKASKTNVVAAVKNSANPYESYFDGQPKDMGAGRDPFFPDAPYPYPAAPTVAAVQAHREPKLTVTAIFEGAHPRAVINTSIVEVGENMQTVHTDSGKVKLKCLEIGADYVEVQVEGEAPKKLYMTKRKGIVIK